MTTNQELLIDLLQVAKNKMSAAMDLIEKDEDCLDLFNSTESYPFTESFDDIILGMEQFISELKGE